MADHFEPSLIQAHGSTVRHQDMDWRVYADGQSHAFIIWYKRYINPAIQVESAELGELRGKALFIQRALVKNFCTDKMNKSVSDSTSRINFLN